LFGISGLLFIEGAAGLVPESCSGLSLALARPAQAAVLLLIFMKAPGGLSSLGLSGPAFFKGVRTGIAWSLALGLVTGIFILMSGYSRAGLFARGHTGMLMVFTTCVSGPLAEELFFRGLIYAWMRRFSFVFAVLISALVFALSHGTASPSLFFIPALPLAGGIIFAMAFERSKSLMGPLVIHVLGNFCVFTGGQIL